MPNYYPDIKNQIPLTKPILWEQIQSDYGVTVKDITPEIKDELAKLSKSLINNRTDKTLLGTRVLAEQKLRKRVLELFSLDIGKDFDKVVKRVVVGKES